MFNKAKSRAKKKGLSFTIKIEDIAIPEYCPVFGLKLEQNPKLFGDNSPSLDRIDNLRGYEPDNIQVISFKANAAKKNLTVSEIEQLLIFMKGIQQC